MVDHKEKMKDRFPSIRQVALSLVSLVTVLTFLLAGCSPEAQRYNDEGNDLFQQGAFIESISEYQRAQVDEPDAAEPYYNAANAYNRMNQADSVLTQTEQAVKTAEPGLASQAWYNLGNAYFGAQNWPEAIEAYQQSLRLEPDDEDAKVNLELALEQMQQEQQQQQQQGEQSEEDQQESEEQQSQPEQGEQEEESEQSQSEPSQSEEQGQKEEQESSSSQPSEQTEGMTEEQAVQLLQALLDESQTLQEVLQEVNPAPGPASEQDW